MNEDIWDKNWENINEPDVHLDLVDIIRQFAPGKKILEVGFGTGGDLYELQKIGFECFGLEKSKIAYQKVKNKYSFNVKYGDGEKSPYTSNSFDLIFHQGLLEHFKKPEKILSDHRRILKKNGVLVIDVPHKWNSYTLYKKVFQLFGTWYGGWEKSYDANGLINLVKQNKFEPIVVFYRGVFPHRWGKFLYPSKISNRKIRKIFKITPVKYLQKFTLYIYKRCLPLQIVSSYNICIVAKKI